MLAWVWKINSSWVKTGGIQHQDSRVQQNHWESGLIVFAREVVIDRRD